MDCLDSDTQFAEYQKKACWSMEGRSERERDFFSYQCVSYFVMHVASALSKRAPNQYISEQQNNLIWGIRLGLLSESWKKGVVFT